MELIQDLQAKTGYPPAAFRTLVKHGELDPGHSEEIVDERQRSSRNAAIAAP